MSSVVWDLLVGDLDDLALIKQLGQLSPADIDNACKAAIQRLRGYYDSPDNPMKLSFCERDNSPCAREGTIAHAVGMLILTHHRLPDGSGSHLRLQAGGHLHKGSQFEPAQMEVAQGSPFWHSKKWLDRLKRAAERLQASCGAPGLDMALRASLTFADHLGSALREASSDEAANAQLGNTKDGNPADPLDIHIDRVWQRGSGCFDMLHRHRERYPALGEDEVPIDIRHPVPAAAPFAWQVVAAREAGQLCAAREGGFFSCLMAGTGTGKTRGAPTLLAAAAFADPRPERRYLRMMLALGLRSLATQSAKEYVDDLRFDRNDVAVLIGQPPVSFKDDEANQPFNNGSESLIALPEWLRVEHAGGGPPPEGDEREADWLRRLSADTDRRLPATLDLILEKGRRIGRVGAAARHITDHRGYRGSPHESGQPSEFALSGSGFARIDLRPHPR